MGKLVFYIQIASGFAFTPYEQVAFLPFTAGAVVVQMGYKAVEIMDSIDNLVPIYTT
jgi:hypothetical protein